MHRVAKRYRFEAAHKLERHDGKCARLHGHSYEFEVEYVGNLITEGPKIGMVVDYGDISKMCKVIVDWLDHRFLAAEDNRQGMIVQCLEESEVADLDVPTSTAENIAMVIAGRILTSQDFLFETKAKFLRVTVWETATSSATYEVHLTGNK